ncbi:MAG: thiamine pyrophosphate-dependent enzyme [Candidatus Methanodesulfokora sp.]
MKVKMEYEEVMLLSGNEAIARGIYEAGASIATGYPGTPSSEVIQELIKLGVNAEWSVNEKVAFEIAYAAALSGLRAAAVMKHLGTHWIIDPLAVSAVTGVEGGLLVVSADDPYPYSSQSSTDTRNHARTVHIPVFEPSDPPEAKEMVKLAFEISELIKLPIMMRYTARLAHGSAPVRIGSREELGRNAEFKKDPSRLVSTAPNARKNIPLIFEKLERAKKLFEGEPWISLRDGSGDTGIIASGVPYLAAMEIAEEMDLPLMKISVSHPLPEGPLLEFISGLKKVVVLEDLDPIIEDQVIILAYSNGLKLDVIGKRSGHLRPYGEIGPDEIRGIFHQREAIKEEIPRRVPQLCPGCPHRGSFLAIKGALSGKGIVLGDRGCYNQGGNPPLRAIDTAIAMGSSIAMAVGLSRSGIKEPIIAVIGDSTFFHAGIPPTIEAVISRSPIVIAILDNSWTAMTGHQPSPSTGLDSLGRPRPQLSVENLLSAIGIYNIKVVDPYNIDEGENAIREAIIKARESSMPSAVIFRRECALQAMRFGRWRKIIAKVDPEKCSACKLCLTTGCPAIHISQESKKAEIDPMDCIGCSICSQICPNRAIEVI